MGGGGFFMEPDNPLLDDYVLTLSRRQPARICFLSTASAESPANIVRFYRAFAAKSIATDITLFDSALPRRPTRVAAIPSLLAEQDIVFVGGGSTVNLLAVWRAHGVDRWLAAANSAGVVLAGVSAGMLCWFGGGVTDSYGSLAPLHDGLGLLSGTACPHYDADPARRSTYRAMIGAGASPGYAADDGAALLFSDGALREVVASRASARAYRVQRVDGEVVETPLSVRYLGAPASNAALDQAHAP
jgi:peptidase E